MWLLNAETLKLEEYLPERCPPYAILSHRWEDKETSFRQMKRTRKENLDDLKILNTCKRTIVDGYRYVWIDTCCINKESSTELSEAINSMFNWYSNSQVCYVYMSDVHNPESDEEFTSSAWFGRGWTLQELLAPKAILFFNRDWHSLGTRDSLLSLISQATEIEGNALQEFYPSKFSIATKMSWVSERKTSRQEDIAYCLLGIFDVNIPLLYGEGSKAFRRLQEEIIRTSDDNSIFVWQQTDSGLSDLLADSPRQFAKTSSFMQCFHTRGGHDYGPTNRGISITFPVCRWTPDIYLTYDGLARKDDYSPQFIALYCPKDGPAWRLHDPAIDKTLHYRFWRGWNHRHCFSDFKDRRMMVKAAHHERGIDLGSLAAKALKHRFGITMRLPSARSMIFKDITISKSCHHLEHHIGRPQIEDRCFDRMTALPLVNSIAALLQPGEYGIALTCECRHPEIDRLAFGFDFEGEPFFLANRRRDTFSEPWWNDLSYDARMLIKENILNCLIENDYRAPVMRRSGKSTDRTFDSKFNEQWHSELKFQSLTGIVILPSDLGIWTVKSKTPWTTRLSIAESDGTISQLLEVRLSKSDNDVLGGIYRIKIIPLAGWPDGVATPPQASHIDIAR